MKKKAISIETIELAGLAIELFIKQDRLTEQEKKIHISLIEKIKNRKYQGVNKMSKCVFCESYLNVKEITFNYEDYINICEKCANKIMEHFYLNECEECGQNKLCPCCDYDKINDIKNEE